MSVTNHFVLPPRTSCIFLSEELNEQVVDESTYEKLMLLCRFIHSNSSTRFVYRADGNADSIYRASYNQGIFAHRFFMIGVKGKFFIDEYDYNRINMFEHGMRVFDEINRIVSLENCIESPAFLSRINKFYQKNPKFVDYFRNQSNREVFASFFNLRDFRINDYYEVFLHTVYKNGICNKESKYLSTSLYQRIARKFQNEGILMVGWLNKSGLIYPNDVNQMKIALKSHELPTWTSVFPHQHEICLKYGLPPHNIIGYYYDKRFYLNHHLIANLAIRNIDEIVKRGCKINQETFLETLHQTRYTRGINIRTQTLIS